MASPNTGYASMPAFLTRGKFAASRRSRRICWHVKHSQALSDMTMKNFKLTQETRQV
jgi:hypothetical protein